MKPIDGEPTPKHEFFIKRHEDISGPGTETKRFECHCIFILEDGHSYVCIDDQKIALKTHQVVLVAKGQIVSFPNDSKLKGYEIHFSDSFWERAPQSASNCKSVLFDRAAENQMIPLTSREFVELNAILELLHFDFENCDYTNKSDALAAYLKIVMIKIANISYSIKDRYNGFEKNKYNEFLKLLDSRYRQSREVSDYCDLLNVTKKHLYEICVKQAGKSPKKIINEIILNESKRLLKFSATPIKQIAATINFTSNDQFSHFFKKETGLSPLKYRERQENFDI